MVRAYLNVAFAYGMRAEHDCTRKDAGARWGIKSNPIAAIPVADGVVNPRKSVPVASRGQDAVGLARGF
jgi:hypothetical protein